ncbi:hypothetical protein ACFQDZ_20930 [Sulfitobacter pacificus]|uniref:hypothetical protein n=1 Tax=Sulfitobacter pacificus TaxID=1499314 RepID=UPI0036156D6D
MTDGQVLGTTTIAGGAVVVNETTVDAALELAGATTVSAGSLTLTAGDVAAVTTSGTGTFTQSAGVSGAVENTGGTVNLNGGTAATSHIPAPLAPAR